MFSLKKGTLKVIFRFQRCHPNFISVIDTAETLDLILIAVSAVSMTPLKFGKKFVWWLKSLWYFLFHDHGGFSAVIDTAETVSAVSLTPLSNFHSVIDTAMRIRSKVSAVSMAPLKRFQPCHWHCGSSVNGVIDTAQTRIMSIILANMKPYAKRF
jgi:hypothetical protein